MNLDYEVCKECPYYFGEMNCVCTEKKMFQII